MSITSFPDIIEQARQVIRSDAKAVLAAENSLTGEFSSAAAIVSSCKGKILVVGSGTSGKIADRAAHLFSVAGSPAFTIAPDAGLHGGLGVVQAEDVVLAISKGGSSAELNEFCKRSKTLCKHLIVITADPKSALASLADCVITLHLPEDTDLGGVVATGCTLAAAAITDALVEIARVSRGYNWEQVLFTHPSGAVGRDTDKSLKRLGTDQ